MAIKDWHESERPREKALRSGVRELSLAELLAILLGSGSQDESAVELAAKILRRVDFDLSRLEKMSLEELQSFKGIGPAKAVTLATAFEFGRRRAAVSGESRPKITSPDEAYRLFRPHLENLDHEEFWIMMLRKGRVIGLEKISEGGLDFSQIDMRLLWQKILNNKATEIIIAHNHPSGNPEPSPADLKITEKIKETGELMNIRLLDHLIITAGNYRSIMHQ